jgi:hypothetical protein
VAQAQQAQRRTRPVIASRGFEAALSGAGVGVNGGMARAHARKERKEREVVTAGGDSGEVAEKDGGKEQQPMTRKERERDREKKRKEREESIFKAGGLATAGASTAGTSNSGAETGPGTGGSSVLPAPTVLTREAPPKILTRPSGSTASAGAGEGAGILNVNVNTSDTTGPGTAAEGGGGAETRGGSRGGRRGRGGRGRGRGVA